MEGADIDLIVAGTASDILMVEGEMKEVQEADMIEAIKVAHEAIKDQCRVIKELAPWCPRAIPNAPTTTRKRRGPGKEDHTTSATRSTTTWPWTPAPRKCAAKRFNHQGGVPGHAHRRGEGRQGHAGPLFQEDPEEGVRNVVLDHGKRLDGRKTDQIRPIWSEVDVLPGTHGSAIFTRGETQAINLVTLGSQDGRADRGPALVKRSENFMLHYNFPSFSTGEVRPIRGPGRREIGHGNLALRALKPVIPTGTDNPYTIRLNCDILESNGSSSSMATVCSGTLALMDAGVKIKAPVSGIAMGMISDGQPPRDPQRHPRRRGLPWATWTSRSAVPKRASPPRRWT
jgi:polyribonucleotide nucleotidyltransferase